MDRFCGINVSIFFALGTQNIRFEWMDTIRLQNTLWRKVYLHCIYCLCFFGIPKNPCLRLMNRFNSMKYLILIKRKERKLGNIQLTTFRNTCNIMKYFEN